MSNSKDKDKPIVNEKTGMRYPPLNDLIARAHNKYELVIATATRAREIVAGKDPLVAVRINNPITIATEEIYEDKVKLHNPSFDGDIEPDHLQEKEAVEEVIAANPSIEPDAVEDEILEEKQEETSQDLFE